MFVLFIGRFILMTGEIIAVGTELLLGDILNTNAQYLSRQLAALGIGVYFQSVVGDNKDRLLNAFENAFKRADLVITTGGLGPTDDDLTKETGAEYFGLEMIEDKESMDNLRDYFKNNNMPETNLKQGYIPKGAKALKNNNGTAPGCIIEKDGKILVMLPGPPAETIPMFEESVIPILSKKQDKTFVSRILRLSGIGESAAAEAIRDIMKESENPTIAPYAKQDEMLFRITAGGNNKDEADKLINPVVKQIYKRLGQYIYGEGEDASLEKAVLSELEKRGLKIACAESCTGGELCARLVNCSGASNVLLEGVVSYSNESKISRLSVKEETLLKYGAVSAETAEEMAKGVSLNLKADIGISTTGVAGPLGGTEEKPVGLVYAAIYMNGKTNVYRYMIKGNRNKIRHRTVTNILNNLREMLIKDVSEK